MHVEATCTPHPDESGKYLLYLELAAGEEAAAARKPVHLVLAIDASSSMGGPRLACAVEAGRAVAERLGGEDMFCLLAFDRSVRPLFGPGRVDGAAKAAIAQALDGLRPGIGTALYDALQSSYEALRRVFVRGTRPHVLLLTDGFPSVGPNRPEAFAELAGKAADEGIVTSAVGVGLDFDEKIAAAVAAGGGRYSFVDKEEDIPGALAQHLKDVVSVAIESVTVRVAPGAAVREAALLHRYPTKVGPDGFVVETGPIGRGSPRRLLFSLRCEEPPAPVAASVALTVRGAAAENDPGSNRILSVPLAPNSPAAAEAVRELHRLVLSSRENAFWEAIRRADANLAHKAHEAALLAVAALERSGASARDLAEDRRRLGDQQAVLDGRLSAEARAMAHKRAHESVVSRITSVFKSEE